MKISMLPLAISLFLVQACQFKQPDYVKTVSPTELSRIMGNEDIFLVDVHTPQARHIKGTDAFIPYNEIDKNIDKLPQDKNTPIYLYCQAGSMGNAASRTLHDLGYQHLYNLDGGAIAWKKAGFAFE